MDWVIVVIINYFYAQVSVTESVLKLYLVTVFSRMDIMYDLVDDGTVFLYFG